MENCVLFSNPQIYVDPDVVSYWVKKFNGFNFYNSTLNMVEYRKHERARRSLIRQCSNCFISKEEKVEILDKILGDDGYKSIVAFYVDKINVI